MVFAGRSLGDTTITAGADTSSFALRAGEVVLDAHLLDALSVACMTDQNRAEKEIRAGSTGAALASSGTGAGHGTLFEETGMNTTRIPQSLPFAARSSAGPTAPPTSPPLDGLPRLGDDPSLVALPTRAKVLARFNEFDLNRDGVLTGSELSAVARGVAPGASAEAVALAKSALASRKAWLFEGVTRINLARALAPELARWFTRIAGSDGQITRDDLRSPADSVSRTQATGLSATIAALRDPAFFSLVAGRDGAITANDVRRFLGSRDRRNIDPTLAATAADLSASFEIFDRNAGSADPDRLITLDDLRTLETKSLPPNVQRLAARLLANDGAIFKALAAATGRVGVLEASELRALTTRFIVSPIPL